MNNQYKYLGQHLTARMSRELIQELFPGQTVHRQEIIRAVDEAHLERGGLPKRSIAHPVGSALSALKADGLAENSEYGVWSILSETIDMNNRYRYFEQVLTPGIAQELIQELFEGQTVQKQEIITAVDEAHLERGGLASEDPVTTALFTMKGSGLAENPEGNVWSILIETPDGSHIKTLNEFINWTAQFESKDYVFRGVPNETYRIQASAYRRPKEDDRNFKKFLEINKGLIEEAALRGYDEDKRNGRELKHLEILAELQHFGAATCLIDFTYNALVALWFACQLDSKTQDSERQPNGKVFAVFNKPPRFTKIEPATLSWTIDRFLQDSDNPQLYHWQPRQQNNRIIAQQSIFLFGDYEFDADGECIIAKKSKESILDELEQASGITEAMLFPDFDGFAWLRREGIQYKQLLDYEYRERAHKRFQDKKYEEAIADYNMAIALDPDYVDAYYRLGLAKFQLEQHEEAIVDFDKALDINPDNAAEVYYASGLAKYELGRDEEAIVDFDKALDINPDNAEVYSWRAIVKVQLGEPEEAIADFDMAINLQPNYANDYNYRGMVKAQLGQADEAIVDFDEAIRHNSNHTIAYFNRGLMKNNLQQYELAIVDFDEAIRLDPNYARAYRHRAESKFRLRRFPEAKADLETVLPMAEHAGNEQLIAEINDMLYEINSRTVGGSEDE